MHNPRETNLAPALLSGGRDVISRSKIFISSSVNLLEITKEKQLSYKTANLGTTIS